MTQAPATPSFGDVVENGWASEENPTRKGYFVRSFKRIGRINPGLTWLITDRAGYFWELQPRVIGDKLTVTPLADALEAQQARIAELEVENERLRLTMLGGEDVAGFASSLPLAQVLDSFRAYETALRDSANSAQALADRYEKALRNLFTTAERVVLSIEQDESGRWLLDGDGERLAGDLLESVDATRQALSSQGRHEGGEPRVDELAMLVRMLVRHVPETQQIHGRALDYLARHGLTGSPLRASPIREPEISRAKRDEIARIIDPEIFADLDLVASQAPQFIPSYSGQRTVDAAYAKADAILNLAPVGGREEGSARADLSPASRSPEQHSDGGEG